MKKLLLGLTAFLTLSVMTGCNLRDSSDKPSDTTSEEQTKSDVVSNVNFFIEASGSMVGYFSSNNKSDLENLIQDYYDRLTEEKQYEKAAHFYFISDKVDTVSSVEDFLKDAKKSCTSGHSDIDQMLKRSMSYKGVNVFISDFGYIADNGNVNTAESQIRKVFAQKLGQNKDFSLAILKYSLGFDGIYRPGKDLCQKSLPIYFWVFGDNKSVKHFVDLDVQTNYEECLLLQADQNVSFEIKSTNSRMVEEHTIKANGWKKDKRDPAYKVSFEADLSTVLLPENQLLDVTQYECTSSSTASYSIDNITRNKDKYIFNISVDRPSPAEVTIGYKLAMPKWVEESNFSGSGIPDEGKTLNIAPQIKGAYLAYEKFKYVFSINFKIK